PLRSETICACPSYGTAITIKSASLTASRLVVPNISPARSLGRSVSTALRAFSASREPMMILTPGAPRRNAKALPRFPVPPTIATFNSFMFSFRTSERDPPHRVEEVPAPTQPPLFAHHSHARVRLEQYFLSSSP